MWALLGARRNIVHRAAHVNSVSCPATAAVPYFFSLLYFLYFLHILNPGRNDVLYTGFGDSKYRACSLLRKMVAAGWLGRKSGRGFYNYS